MCNNLLIHNVEVDRNRPSGVWIKIGVSVECHAIVNGYAFLELARAPPPPPTNRPPLAAAALVALDSQNRQLRILTRSNCIEVSQKAVIWHFILCIQYMRRMKQRRTTGCAYGAQIRTAIADDRLPSIVVDQIDRLDGCARRRRSQGASGSAPRRFCQQQLVLFIFRRRTYTVTT